MALLSYTESNIFFHPVEWLEEWPDEDHSNRLVFITRDIKKSYIEEFFKIIGENEI